MFLSSVLPILLPAVFIAGSLFSLPAIIASDARNEQSSVALQKQPFPISVDPTSKKIVESPAADILLKQDTSSKLSAAAWNAKEVFTWIANVITSLPFYEYLGNADVRFVVIQPGFRREQVADAFGRTLGWSAATRKQFLTNLDKKTPTLSEGEFVPGTYEVHPSMAISDVQNLLADRFANQILARYTEDVASVVPLRDTLIIASLIERETGGTDDMRMISGVIWNRLFDNMNLQIDATLQYAKAESTNTWWPGVNETMLR